MPSAAHQVSQDDCARNNPCQNGGECVQRAGMTACNCPLGFGGAYCEQREWPGRGSVAGAAW